VVLAEEGSASLANFMGRVLLNEMQVAHRDFFLVRPGTAELPWPAHLN
jgi:hypothetical protein